MVDVQFQSTQKPVSAPCERNRDPILELLKPLLLTCKRVLEIGSGTGQHAVYFAEHMPHLEWHASDVADNHPGILAWMNDGGPGNVFGPLELDVQRKELWPSEHQFDAVFTANTTHIMSVEAVADMFECVGKTLKAGGVFCQYGPFRYDCAYTSESNAGFDDWLKNRDPESGIRDFEWLQLLASEQDMVIEKDHSMPANNQLLVWRKGST